MAGRVLHVLSQRPSWTGSGIALDALVQAAAAKGWEQQVVVGTPSDDPKPQVGGLDGDRVHPLLFETDELPFLLPGMSDVMPYASSRFSELSEPQLDAYTAAWRNHVDTIIDRFQPDVIHCHHVWILSGIVTQIAGGIPVTIHCHATGLRQMRLCPHLADEVRDGCELADQFVVLHREHSDELSRALRISADRIEIVGSGFDPHIFHSDGPLPNANANGTADSDRQFRLAYAGKLSRAKGLPWLLEAVDTLVRRYPNLELHIAGSGVGQEADEIRCRAEELSPNVVLHGQVDQHRLAELFRQSHAFVLPSFYEGLPLVLIEAIACGCQLVSTALPGVVEQIAPQFADCLELVEPPATTDGSEPRHSDLPAFMRRLTESIESALKKPRITETSQRVAHMTWPAVFDRIERLWNKLEPM